MHNPPPFTGADIRISPSGPYVTGPGGGGIIQYGADAIVGVAPDSRNVVLTDTAAVLQPVPRSIVADIPSPMQVVFPQWVSGSVLRFDWALNGIWTPDEDQADADAFFIVYPAVDVGAGFQLLNNGGQTDLFYFNQDGEDPVQSGTLHLSGSAAIRITDPVQPPTVRLYYGIAGLLDPPAVTGSLLTFNGVAAAPATVGQSGWLTAMELASGVVVDLPPEVVLTPI